MCVSIDCFLQLANDRLEVGDAMLHTATAKAQEKQHILCVHPVRVHQRRAARLAVASTCGLEWQEKEMLRMEECSLRIRGFLVLPQISHPFDTPVSWTNKNSTVLLAQLG
jgi:hypothetical protein